PAAQARSQPFHNVLITINPRLPGQPARWAAWVPDHLLRYPASPYFTDLVLVSRHFPGFNRPARRHPAVRPGRAIRAVSEVCVTSGAARGVPGAPAAPDHPHARPAGRAMGRYPLPEWAWAYPAGWSFRRLRWTDAITAWPPGRSGSRRRPGASARRAGDGTAQVTIFGRRRLTLMVSSVAGDRSGTAN